MTKKILLALVVLTTTTISFSQEKKDAEKQRKSIFGLKVGTNFSWYKPDSRNISKGGLKLGTTYGIMYDKVFLQNYALSMEFLVSTLNGTLKFRDKLTYTHPTINSKNGGDSLVAVSNVEYEYKVRYIQVPVSFKFRTKEIGAMKYFAQFGFAPGVRIASKADINKDNANGMPWNEDDRKNIKTNKDGEEYYEPKEFDDDVNLFTMPLLIGGGFEYNISGNTSLYGCLRFENGFTNVLKSKNERGLIRTESIAQSKNIALSIGCFF